MSRNLEDQNRSDGNATNEDVTQSLEEIEAVVDRETRVRSRAYELYLGRGQELGLDLDDWLQAEHEIEVDGDIPH